MPPNNEYIKEETMDDLWNVWYTELHQGKSGLTFKVSRLIESIESEFQRIDVIETEEFGKALVLYGSLMVAEGDTGAYNEMIAHVPMCVHPRPKEVLVIGGGDGGCVTNVLRHPDVARCTICEIDEKVIEISKKHFPALTAGYSDPRCRIHIGDGKHFLETTDETFDIIILDLSDPIGPAADLFQKSFHRQVFECLNDDGIMVAQSESPLFNPKTVRAMYHNFYQIFPIVHMYACLMPIYPSSYWSFAFCSKTHHPLDDFSEARYRAADLNGCTYYNRDVHFGSFGLPQYVKQLLAE